MLIEAVRLYLVELGVREAAEWPAHEVIDYIDTVLLQQQQEDAETVKDLIADLMHHVRKNLLTINEVLEHEVG